MLLDESDGLGDGVELDLDGIGAAGQDAGDLGPDEHAGLLDAGGEIFGNPMLLIGSAG